MKTTYLINTLKENRDVFQSLLINKSEEEFLWRPQPEKWSLLEIVCHLHDEEREDFRARVRHVLYTPNEEIKSFDPLRWVTEREYSNKNYHEILVKFLEERDQSITWLDSLENVQWNNVYLHPTFGEMSAYLFLSNWLAHDYLHIRQIVRYNYLYLKENSNIDLQYAGEW